MDENRLKELRTEKGLTQLRVETKLALINRIIQRWRTAYATLPWNRPLLFRDFTKPASTTSIISPMIPDLIRG